jgi:hypothetical protein
VQLREGNRFVHRVLAPLKGRACETLWEICVDLRRLEVPT